LNVDDMCSWHQCIRHANIVTSIYPFIEFAVFACPIY